MVSDRINARLLHIKRRDIYAIEAAIREGYQDIAAGRYFKSTGNFEQDMHLLDTREQQSP